MSIYRAIVLNHYHHPRNSGRLKKADRTVKKENSLCGDRIIMDVKFSPSGAVKSDQSSNIIRDIRFIGKGCAISIAAASLLTEAVKGKTKAEVLGLNKNFVLKKLGVKLSPNRLKCALLPLEALKQAVT